MLVYGDAKRVEDPREKALAIRAGLERLVTTRLRIERHAILAGSWSRRGSWSRGSATPSSPSRGRSGRARWERRRRG